MSVADFLLANWPTLLLLASYPVGATIHITIAYRTISKEATRSRKEYQAWLEKEVLPKFKASILEGVKELFPETEAPDTDALAEQVGTAVANAMTQRLTSAAGVAARKSQSKLEAIIMDLPLESGNPLLDGMFAAIPRDAKRGIAVRMARAIRKGGGVDALLTEEGDPEPESRASKLGPEWH
jgi:hypothetical protein